MEKYKMMFVYVLVTCMAVVSAASTVGARGKTYPGFTYWSNKKTGEVIKLIGPMYLKIKKFEVTKPPYDLKSNISVHIVFTPTIECRSIFVDHVVSINGFIFSTSDPAQDLCMKTGDRKATFECPLQPGKNYIFKQSWNLASGYPVLSARYGYKATVTTVDQISGEDITLLRCEMNIVI